MCGCVDVGMCVCVVCVVVHAAVAGIVCVLCY